MPYKDPESKRRWERDHREERNARRRISAVEAQMSDPITHEKLDSGANLLPVLVLGLTFLVLLLVAGWRFSGILEPSGHI